MKKRLFGYVQMGLGVFLALGVSFLFTACQKLKEDGSRMNCYHAQTAVMWIGIALFVLALIAVLFHKRICRILAGALSLAASVIGFLIPGTLIRMCASKTMQCYAVMQPAVRILCVISAVVALAGLITAVREKE